MSGSASLLKKSNRRAIAIILLALVLAFAALSMPAYRFSADVYTKKR